MSDYLTDDEQWEAIKKWLKQYGFSIVLGILIALSAGYGWRYYQGYRLNLASQASMVYEQLMNSMGKNDVAAAKTLSDQLKTDYHSTPYATLSEMLLAKQAVDKGDLKQAATHLSWVVDHGSDKNLTQIARLRLARVQISQGQPKQALQTLATVEINTYLPAIDMIKGDAYKASGQPQNARQAYQQALALMPNNQLGQAMVKMKIEQLSS